jgi:hypothetical protein
VKFRGLASAFLFGGGALLLASACTAGSPAKPATAAVVAAAPAAIPPSDPATAKMEASFRSFSAEWIKKLERASAQNRAKGTSTKYKGYDPNFRIELKATGSATAPYVGILRYTEHTYDCARKAAAAVCPVAASAGVMEIFRFQGGRWVY